MKLIWNIVSIVAIANLLAIIGLVGWLVASDRLNSERMQTLRTVLGETTSAEKARLEEEEAERLAAEEAAKVEPSGVAVSANELLQVRLEMSEIDRQRTELLQRQIKDMQSLLAKERAEVDEKWANLQSAQEAFRKEVARVAELDGGKQFKKAVKTLEAQKPEVASSLLQQLITNGPELVPELALESTGDDAQDPREEGMIRAVAYLNAMQERSRNKLMDQIAQEQPLLATELLERLRVRGLMARVPEAP